ncbi:hypothetical protein GGR55DRAFT_642938 [Xylaria sp. FL0064]|nr:hypothetical protein GGR55DRAFT_642938 [Xylaria sp. FL0064]
MSNPALISSNNSDPKPSLVMEEAGLRIEKWKNKINAERDQVSLRVTWVTAPRPSPPTRIENPNGIPKSPVNIDVVVIFGLSYTPLRWLHEYLGQSGADSRVLEFTYHPSQILTPGLSHYGITSLAERLLDQLGKLRAGGTKRRIIFLAIEIGCIIVKKALTLASRTKSPHGEIFDACRTLVNHDNLVRAVVIC